MDLILHVCKCCCRSGVCGSGALHPVFNQVLPREICVCGDCTLLTATGRLWGCCLLPGPPTECGVRTFGLGTVWWMKNDILCSFNFFCLIVDDIMSDNLWEVRLMKKVILLESISSPPSSLFVEKLLKFCQHYKIPKKWQGTQDCQNVVGFCQAQIFFLGFNQVRGCLLCAET